ncbi:MAG: hypothetical protein WDO18_21015 [Acidobacteriota bacterium]
MLSGLGFTTFDNTYGITAGILDLYWWNELSSPSPHTLTAGLTSSATSVTLTPAGTPTIPLIQVGAAKLWKWSMC